MDDWLAAHDKQLAIKTNSLFLAASTKMRPVQSKHTNLAHNHNSLNHSNTDTNHNHTNNNNNNKILNHNLKCNQLTGGLKRHHRLAPSDISASRRNSSRRPLGIEEYEQRLRRSASDFELVNRVFEGSIASDQLRAALWPYLFGLVSHRGRFQRCLDGQSYRFVEHEKNRSRWSELQRLYQSYQNQWRSILPDQELRFSTFRERKSLIERDVVRCDRLHPFYADQPDNLSALTNLLMTYMMYDFDIGYVQGMSDVAGPILCMYRGDTTKAFWVFVEVMKLLRRNFEHTQKTIHFQLQCLFELIKLTDPKFAQYLQDHDSSNCFFIFRAIVCQFKRELTRDDADDYSNVLLLWDTIWSVQRRAQLMTEQKRAPPVGSEATNGQRALDRRLTPPNTSTNTNGLSEPRQQTPSPCDLASPRYSAHENDPNSQSDSPRHNLTETEIFVQALCLAMIRRERDLILANKLDGTDIHLHFIDPKLATDLDGFIEDAIEVYFYIKDEVDMDKLTKPKRQTAPIRVPSSTNRKADPNSPYGSPASYDLLADFYVINCVSGSS